MIPEISILYVGLLGLLFVPFTAYVGLYRFQTGISLLDGDNATMRRRMRAHANFTESVPIALILLVLMEVSGAGGSWLHTLGVILVVSRVVHYLTIVTNPGNTLPRAASMVGTLGMILAASGWLLYHVISN